MVRLLLFCNLCPSANLWQNALVKAVGREKLASEKEPSKISNDSKKSWGSVVLGRSALRAAYNIETPDNLESTGCSATSMVCTQSICVRRDSGLINSWMSG